MAIKCLQGYISYFVITSSENTLHTLFLKKQNQRVVGGWWKKVTGVYGLARCVIVRKSVFIAGGGR